MTAPGGAEQVTAFALVLCVCIVVAGVIGLVCTAVFARHLDRSLRERDARRDGELDGLVDKFTETLREDRAAAAAQHRAFAERLLGRAPVAVREKGPIGFRVHDKRGRSVGSGSSRLIVVYEPAPGDDAAGTLRERAS